MRHGGERKRTLGGLKVSAIIVPRSVRLTQLSRGTIWLHGSEQTVLDYGSLGRVMGYLDMSQMGAGDSLTVREYMRLGPGEAYRKYHEESYTGVQPVPVLYVAAKESGYGVRVTVQRTGGTINTLDFNFLLEV